MKAKNWVFAYCAYCALMFSPVANAEVLNCSQLSRWVEYAANMRDTHSESMALQETLRQLVLKPTPNFPTDGFIADVQGAFQYAYRPENDTESPQYLAFSYTLACVKEKQ